MVSQEFKNQYLREDSRSAQLYSDAINLLPGGNTRQSLWSSPHPAYAASGKGCYVTDVDGQQRVDLVNNFTALIHGHANPQVIAAVHEQMSEGTAFGLPTQYEIDLARLLTERVGSIERIRFTNSGTEAVMMAIKVARAFTGRSGVAKFEGCYHGGYDPVEVSQAPTPENWGPLERPTSVPYYPAQPGLNDVVVLPFNEPDICERLIVENAHRLAVVVLDPHPYRAGMVSGEPEFLRRIRDVTLAHGILLLADEVMSFRLHAGGAQTMLNIQPDLTTLAKIIGGGFPVGAVGGRADIMELLDPSSPNKKLSHSGTYNGNPVTMLAGLVAMQMMTDPEFERLTSLGEHIRVELHELFERVGANWQITGSSNVFRLHPNRRGIRHYRDSFRTDDENRRMLNMYQALMGRGYMLTPDGMGNLSTPMTRTEVDGFVEAVEQALSGEDA